MKNSALKQFFENIFKNLKRKENALVSSLLITNKTENTMENLINEKEVKVNEKFKFWFVESLGKQEEKEVIALYKGEMNPFLFRGLSSSSLGIIKKLKNLVVTHEDMHEQFMIQVVDNKDLNSISELIRTKLKETFIWVIRDEVVEQEGDIKISYNQSVYEFYLKSPEQNIRVIKKTNMSREEFKNRLDKTGLDLFMTISVKSTIGSLVK